MKAKSQGSWLVGAVSLASVVIFAWPLLITTKNLEQANFAQSVFLLLMPVLIGLVLIELSQGQLDTRTLAVLGVLIAVNSVVRLLGAGTAGIETVFFLILIGAYSFGASFGYLLGAGSILVSALLSGGVGPWLPFQMMAAGLLGLLAGYLPHPKRMGWKLFWLVLFGVIGAYIYGALMTLWNWPFLAGMGGTLGYQPGAGLSDNLVRFVGYELVTGGLLWDTGRAITTAVLTLLTAPTLLPALRRAGRRAGLENAV